LEGGLKKDVASVLHRKPFEIIFRRRRIMEGLHPN